MSSAGGGSAGGGGGSSGGIGGGGGGAVVSPRAGATKAIVKVRRGGASGSSPPGLMVGGLAGASVPGGGFSGSTSSTANLRLGVVGSAESPAEDSGSGSPDHDDKRALRYVCLFCFCGLGLWKRERPGTSRRVYCSGTGVTQRELTFFLCLSPSTPYLGWSEPLCLAPVAVLSALRMIPAVRSETGNPLLLPGSGKSTTLRIWRHVRRGCRRKWRGCRWRTMSVSVRGSLPRSVFSGKTKT